ncbi:ABC transporter permease [Methanooceanicella nereidis]|nr:ABC transporter permease [Methanocella sp. CWC-04]
MAVTDLKLRYKNSVLGIVWSLLQPLLMLLVLYIVFSSIFANRSIDHYPLFLLLGIISWGFMDKATNMSLGSIVGKPNLVKKIYFPREVLVISACLTALMMTALEFVVFGAFMIVFGLLPTLTAILFPAVMAVEFIFVLGISLGIASLNVRYRDVQWIWGVVMQAGFFLTPIIYSLSMLQGVPFVELLKYNPMGVIMEMLRGVLIYDALPVAQNVAYIISISLLALAFGWIVFSKLEPKFAEEV